jgi:hypothetical protein
MIVWSASSLGKRVSHLGVLVASAWLLTGTQANGQAATEVAQTDEAAQLQTKYPDADLAVTEVGTAIYKYTILKPTQIGRIAGNGPSSHVEQNCMFCGKRLIFLGDVNAYVGVAASRDLSSRIINAASLDYDLNRADNPPLAALGVVELNENGLVKSGTAKSGLVNWGSMVTFKDNGRTRTVFLSDINSWVNNGGDNWISFSVGKAQELNSNGDPTGGDIPVTVSMDRKGPNGRVTVHIAGKYAFHPSMKDHTTLVFSPAVVATSKPQSQPR